VNEIHNKPIAARIDWLFELAGRHGENCRSPEARLARQRYLSEHPTAIAVLKCMDGRITIPVATNTPTGILMPFRNLGGMFDLGWPHLGEALAHHVLRMTGWADACSSSSPITGPGAIQARRRRLPTPAKFAARSNTSLEQAMAQCIRWSAALKPMKTPWRSTAPTTPRSISQTSPPQTPQPSPID
jgi:hypothetical protein